MIAIQNREIPSLVPSPLCVRWPASRQVLCGSCSIEASDKRALGMPFPSSASQPLGRRVPLPPAKFCHLRVRFVGYLTDWCDVAMSSQGRVSPSAAATSSADNLRFLTPFFTQHFLQDCPPNSFSSTFARSLVSFWAVHSLEFSVDDNLSNFRSLTQTVAV